MGSALISQNIDYFQSAGDECFSFYLFCEHVHFLSEKQENFSLPFMSLRPKTDANWIVVGLYNHISFGVFFFIPNFSFSKAIQGDQDYVKVYDALVDI